MIRIKIMNKLMRQLMPNILAICLCPFGIYCRSYDIDQEDIDHELIHWQQQKEMLILFFYLWYIIEWLIKIPKYKSEAYWEISFEREAYARPKNRKHFGWIKYIKK